MFWLLVGCGTVLGTAAAQQSQVPPTATPQPVSSAAAPALLPNTAASPTLPPTAIPSASVPATALPTAAATLPPITANPQNVQAPVGTTQTVALGGILGSFTAVAQNSQIVDVGENQDARTVSIAGKMPGTTAVTVTDSRGVGTTIGVKVAYNAANIPSFLTLQITGDPASAEYVRRAVVRKIAESTQLQEGAQLIVTADDVPVSNTLGQDDSQIIDVPVLAQGEAYFSVQGTTRVQIENIAAPRISPDLLMVSDFPEKLSENGTLFTADLHRNSPSRFLYFHYNPPGQVDRRIVLIAENHSSEPATLQFISGRGGPSANEMEVGHDATREFLVSVVQNQGRLVVLPANSTTPIATQSLPAGAIAANLLQLRVLSGADVHLTLVAQNASDDPAAALTTGALLTSAVPHARGIYTIPEFHYARQWYVNDQYLELPIGQIPLPNQLQGETLAGDYGVLQSFVVDVENPFNSPRAIAIYEDPRGGRATGTYIIDGVLIQSHQVPAFSRYKVRQYVVPAKGFVRVTIVSMPEAGSSYPLKLVFAPDDGSVAPGGPGSPIY